MKNSILQSIKNRLRCGLSLTVFCFLAGCSGSAEDLPELAEVSGTVSMEGEPLSGAKLMFIPSVGGASIGNTDEMGRYKLRFNKHAKGAVLGQHIVQITKYGEPGSANDTKNLVPHKYGRKSKLTADVVTGVNELDFAL